MKQITKRLSVVCALGLFGSLAFGEDATPPTTTAATTTTDKTAYTCSSSGTSRTIEVVYEAQGAKTPCKVNYTKGDDTAAGTQTLWTSQSMEGFCEEKAKGLADKLTTSGWSCQ